MPRFVSKPSVSEGIVPSDPQDLATKEYVDEKEVLSIDGGGPDSEFG